MILLVLSLREMKFRILCDVFDARAKSSRRASTEGRGKL